MNAQDFIEHDAKKDIIERLRKEQIILDSKFCALKNEYDTNAKVYSDLRKECTLWYDEKCFRPQPCDLLLKLIIDRGTTWK